jgi:hypothetical protein
MHHTLEHRTRSVILNTKEYVRIAYLTLPMHGEAVTVSGIVPLTVRWIVAIVSNYPRLQLLLHPEAPSIDKLLYTWRRP